MLKLDNELAAEVSLDYAIRCALATPPNPTFAYRDRMVAISWFSLRKSGMSARDIVAYRLEHNCNVL